MTDAQAQMVRSETDTINTAFDFAVSTPRSCGRWAARGAEDGRRTPDSPGGHPGAPNGRKRKAIGLFLLVLAATTIAGFAYWRYRQTHVSTDDAYIDGRIHLVSARVQGNVTEVRVRDNQPVKAGEPLLLIDPEPFAVENPPRPPPSPGGPADLDAARKDLEAAKAQLLQLSAGIKAARAGTAYSAARLSQASRDAVRMKQLFERQVVSREAFEKAQTDAETAKAQDDLAKEELLLAEAAIPTQKAQIAQREARVAQQQAPAAPTGVRPRGDEAVPSLHRRPLPADGYVTRKKRRNGPGRFPGQSLLAVAALDNVWVWRTSRKRTSSGSALGRKWRSRGHVQGEKIQGNGRQHHGGDPAPPSPSFRRRTPRGTT